MNSLLAATLQWYYTLLRAANMECWAVISSAFPFYFADIISFDSDL